MTEDHDSVIKSGHEGDFAKRLREVQNQFNQLQAKNQTIWEIFVQIGNC